MGDKLLLGMLLFSMHAFAQVGIGTTSPIATLDINGDLAVSTMSLETKRSIARDSVMVLSTGGIVKRISANDIVNEGIPSLAKGLFSSSSAVTISLSSGTEIIPFDDESFDLNSEFDTSTHIFTAQSDGYYEVYVQIETDGTIAIASDFGVSILHNSTVVATSSYANVGVLSINVTPPVRSTYTILQLTAGDTIQFNLTGSTGLGNVDISGGSTNSFFSINQIR